MIAGVIEGFYGTPWSLDDRQSCLDDLAAWGGNWYVWAPKSEPRHRDLWREPFTSEELAGFASLATRTPVAISIGLTPGSEATAAEVATKLRPAVDSGARGITLCFDDLPALGAGKRHREIANEIAHVFSTEVWLVPTHYAGTESSPYLRELCDGLDPRILVMWTGGHVVSDRISTSEAELRMSVTGGRRPLLWDNTPVNDALMSEALHLGPYSGRDTSLRNVLSGVLVNPMEFTRASKPTIRSAMAWCAGQDPFVEWGHYVDDCGWRVLAEATAFPDDEHWPGARPSTDWWNEVANLSIDDPHVEPWVQTAREGAALVLRAQSFHENPPNDPQHRAMALIGLAVAWRAWRRSDRLVFGAGPRLRPVLTNDASGRFTWNRATFQDNASLVDDVVQRVLRSA
jgi:hypothetical protein